MGGNRLADKIAKAAAKELGAGGDGFIRTFVLCKVPELTSTLPQYIPAQDQLAKTERATKNEKGWWELSDGRVTGTQGISPHTGNSGSPGSSLGT